MEKNLEFIKIAEAYSEDFSALMEKQGEWSDDHELWFTEWEAWSFSDMRYIVDKYGHLLQKKKDIADEETRRYILITLREDVEAWIEYNVAVADFGIQYINLKSWLNGAPRMSQEQIDKLKESKERMEKLKKAFVEECNLLQIEYGKQNTSSQPEHLRDLRQK